MISIHALLAESDSPRCGRKQVIYYFYPRSPCGERHHILNHYNHRAFISIHALLAESDLHESLHRRWFLPFLSTLSLRRATAMVSRSSMSCQFLSTLSLRRATKPAQPAPAAVQFLSTLSLRRATYIIPICMCVTAPFLSTLSLRRATRCHCLSGQCG